MKPKRIQRKRTKGWRMPPGTIYVGRPTKWGNPFKLMRDNLIHCDATHRRKILHPWVIFDNDNMWLGDTGLQEVIRLYRQWVWGYLSDNNIVIPTRLTGNEIKKQLCGKDLACWCPLDKPCHADVLIEIANS